MATLNEMIEGKADSFEPTGLPSYLEATNGHVRANTGFSLLEPSTYGEATVNSGKFVASAIVRAVASVYNTVPTVANWFGAGMEEADTYDLLAKLDNNLADYYAQNSQTVNVVGDVVASIVPGMVGVKGLRAGQMALANFSRGKAGLNFAYNTGMLPTYAAAKGFEAGRTAALANSSFTLMNAEVMKSVAAGVAQQGLEGVAFMTMAGATMGSSPLFEGQDASDILWNGLTGGGLLGAGIMGSVAAAQTISAVRKGVKITDAFLRPARTVSNEAAYGALSPTTRIIYALDDLHHPPTFAPTSDAAEAVAFNKTLTRRQGGLKLAIQTDMHAITGDKELANQLSESILAMDYDTAASNLLYLQSVGRIGATGNRLTALEKIAATLEKKGETVPNVAINYLNLRTGQMLLEPPAVSSIADIAANEAAVLQFVKSQKFKLTDNYAPSLVKSPQVAEARAIWASELDFANPDLVVKPFDVPVIDAAIASGVSHVNVEGRGLLSRQDLITHVKNIKDAEAELIAANSPKASTAEIAKRINADVKYLEEGGDLVHMSLPVGEYTKPTWVKLAYDVQPMYDVDGFVMDAIAHSKQNQKVMRQAADTAFAKQFPDDYANMPYIGDRAMATANRYGAGTGFFKGANENYGSLGSAVQAVGAVSHKLKERLIAGVSERFNSLRYGVMQDAAAQDDLVVAYNMLLGTGERHVLYNGQIMPEKLMRWYEAGADGVMPEVQTYTLKSPASEEFLSAWVQHNDDYLISKAERLAIQIGGGAEARTGHIYIPPPDPSRYNHFAFVVDASVTNQGNVRMIHAASQNELEALANKVTGPGLKVIYKADNEAFFKARQEYEYALGINESFTNSAVARTGKGAPYFAVTDANKILDEMMEWRKRADVTNMREYVKLKYAPEVTELNRLADSWDATALSRKAYSGKYAGDTTANPYKSFIDTMLDVSPKENYPIWTPINRLLETGVSRFAARYTDAMNTAVDDASFRRMSDMLEEAGISANFDSAATMALANHTAPKPVLEEFIRKGNSLLSFLMLRSDPLNAVNNGVGHSVLYGTETRNLIEQIKAGNTETAGQLAKLAGVNVPGGIGNAISPSKLATDAYSAYAKMLGGAPEMRQLEETFRRHGWMPSFVEQDRAVIQHLTLTGTETQSQLRQRIEDAVKAITKYPVKFNQSVEDMNRFVSAYTAKTLTDIAVQHGVMRHDEAFSYINTFVNRTQGNYIASQRPMLFQGPVGQAVGLFQTYQFNLLQQLFRYVGDKQTKSVATLLGLQGSIYGMNGLPAFNFINQHIVGKAAGNTENKDVISQTYDTVGKEAGDWLMYGMASNMFLHPDLKVNLYTRGDINPRQVTVIPTTLADVPIVGAASKFFTSLGNTLSRLSAGGDPYSTILQGVEHAGISRPLAGLAQTMQAFGNNDALAYSTTSKGSILMANDLLSFATLGRLAGGRPLDEAIANDALYRVKSYEAAQHQKISQLGAAIRSQVQSGANIDAVMVQGFAKEYAERGGKQEQFSKFMSRQMMSANTAQANQLAFGLKTHGSQYMQTIMGGYRLQELEN